MRGIAEVLEVELPVSLVAVLEHAAGHLELPVRGAIDHVVERCDHVPEIVLEARTMLRQAAEDEAAIARKPRHTPHCELGIGRIEVRGISLEQRRGLEPAIQVIGPAVIAAAKLGGVSGVGRHDHGAAMGALVVQQLELSRGIANE